MFKIGDIVLKNKVVLAPMAGITSSAFRIIIKEMDAGLIFAEMVSDKAITYQNEKSLSMLKMNNLERPIVQQIFGNDIKSLVTAAKYIEREMKPDIIDINMGCPVPKVALRSQAGSALLKNPKQIYEIVSAVVKAVNIPVTVKIRSGWDKDSINAVEVAKICEQAGAKAITVHPRTRSQGYSGLSDWNIIKEVKANVSIPVIGNGDIKSCYDAKRMIEETNCDAVMIGRACLGNPWLIKECVQYLETGKEPEVITKKEKLEMVKKHLQLLKDNKDEKRALLEMRSHIGWYLKGMPNKDRLVKSIFNAKKVDEIIDILNKEEEND